MSCCGKMRDKAAQEAGALLQREVQRATAVFEYVGHTGLTARGPVSGAHYQFQKPGARVTIDARDARALSRVPVLRHVRSGGTT